MKEVEYLRSKLQEFVSRFAGIHIRYAYDKATDYHIVEVDPESVRRGNASYKEAELALYLDFMSLFPESCLLIAKPNDAYDMRNLMYENNKQETLSQRSWLDFNHSMMISWGKPRQTYSFLDNLYINNSKLQYSQNIYALAA